MKYFYSHIIEIESITASLDEVEFTAEQKIHLAFLIDSMIHHTVLDTIFYHLPQEHHAYFVERLKINPEDKAIMDFLISKLDNIESQIKESVEEVKKDLHKDIKESKRISDKKGEKIND